MTLQQLISLGIQLSMALMVFSVVLGADIEDLLYVWRRPSLLLRSLFSMVIVMPAVAILIALTFDLERTLKVALMALAVAPVPPFLPGSALKAGARASYMVGLLTISALLAIVFVPTAASLMGRIFGADVRVATSGIAVIVVTSLLVPLVLGIVLSRLAPRLAAKLSRPVAIFGTVLLLASLLPALFRIWPAIVDSLGTASLLTIAGFVLVGLTVGHLLGGPANEDRRALALATASRHPAVALAVAHNNPNLPAVIGTVLVVLIVGVILSQVYVRWFARATTRANGTEGAG